MSEAAYRVPCTYIPHRPRVRTRALVLHNSESSFSAASLRRIAPSISTTDTNTSLSRPLHRASCPVHRTRTRTRTRTYIVPSTRPNIPRIFTLLISFMPCVALCEMYEQCTSTLTQCWIADVQGRRTDGGEHARVARAGNWGARRVHLWHRPLEQWALFRDSEAAYIWGDLSW
ncbi:hypothetical protein K466DRAFT_223576 [Polyporus arcularius HHB13444]|uniref:Uncharacterized protein n=1 Tax=Polyporus arcularius HHB13444 TaxID=1314778 RepID=A0A5C3Q269_9APHY|nr:hypothetical protein K466DRAFT_223576 [Polyporus arcularius HHB13444]